MSEEAKAVSGAPDEEILVGRGAGGILFAWTFAIMSRDTLSCRPIGEFARRYVRSGMTVIDPFARDCTLGTHRNDLNKATKANYNMDALDFLNRMRAENVVADVVIFDPPFSPRQLKECYDDIGKRVTIQDTQRTCSWRAEKDVINDITRAGSIFLHFGWTTHAMGKRRGWNMKELLVVCHGPGSNDTLCMAEVRDTQQFELLGVGAGGEICAATNPKGKI